MKPKVSPVCTSAQDAADQRPMNPDKAERAKDEVEAVLHQSPRDFNLERSRWRLQDIGQIIPWLNTCTLAGISQILGRLKISLKQAIRYVRSPDPERSLKRRKMGQVFQLALSQPEAYVTLFQDEFSFYSQPDNTLKYGAQGRQAPRVYRGSTDSVLTRIGAVMDGYTGQVCYLQGDKFGKVAMSQLYRQVRERYPRRKLFVIQDNVFFHGCDDVLATMAELDITPVFLPTYASWLNPIEKLWRWLNADVLHGHEFGHDHLLLRQFVADFLDQFADGSSALLRYVGLLPD